MALCAESPIGEVRLDPFCLPPGDIDLVCIQIVFSPLVELQVPRLRLTLPNSEKKLILHLLSSINPIKPIPSVGHLRLSWVIINVAWEQSTTCNVVKPVLVHSSCLEGCFFFSPMERQRVSCLTSPNSPQIYYVITLWQRLFVRQGTILDPDLFPIGNGIWCQWDHP